MRFKDLIYFCDKSNIKYEIDGKTAPLTSIKVGKTASLIVYPSSISVFCDILNIIDSNKYKHIIIGNGTNCYFCDCYDGVVIVTKYLDSIIVQNDKISAMCGAKLINCSAMALFHSLSGLEFAYGIPGTIGGAVYMNADAYGSFVSDVVVKSTVYDKSKHNIVELQAKEHLFGPKSSVFLSNNNLVILETTFKLFNGEYEHINSQMHDYAIRRKETQPLNLPSAGSAFKRLNNNIPSKLIDECGLKGFKIGDAQISKKHAGFIVNTGSATSRDINELLSYIKSKIYDNYGVKLEEEIIYIE